jgi:hypothetical protein
VLCADDAEITADNRDLVDNNKSQKLTQQEIVAMQDTGASGEDIIKALVQNSASYQGKTEFSKAKYLKKKAKKCVSTPMCSIHRYACVFVCVTHAVTHRARLYLPGRHILVLEVLEPSLDNIVAAYFNRKPSSIWYRQLPCCAVH